MDVLAGVFVAVAGLLVTQAALALTAHWFGRREVDLRLAAMLVTSTAIMSVAVAYSLVHGRPEQMQPWGEGLNVAQLAALAAGAAHVHLAAQYAKLRHKLALVISAYTLALVLAALGWNAWVRMPSVHLQLWSVAGLRMQQLWAPPTVLGMVALWVTPLMHAAGCWLFGMAYLRRRSEALTLFVGAGMVTLAAVNDALLGLGVMHGVRMAPLAMVLFGVSLSMVFLLRTRRELAELKRLKHDNKRFEREVAKKNQVLEQAKRRESLAVIGEMAAVIAHEVRNPLAIMNNAVSSLRREDLASHDRSVLLTILVEESERLNRLVTDLLRYARPIAVQRQHVLLHELAKRATLLQGAHPGVRVVYDEASARGQIWGDATLLRQVVDNLVENAIQATGPGGTVTISVQPQDKDGVGGFVLSVADDGEGMDTQVRTSATKPFFTTRPAGTGLGLAIVNRIVEAHGGELTLQSRRGEGTEARVFLPIGTESLPPPEPVGHDSRPPARVEAKESQEGPRA